jgi:hypothetical protein
VKRLTEQLGELREGRERVQRICASAARMVLTAVVVSGTARAQAETPDGCQGPPAQETTISKATVVFVWPCFAHADTFLEPDPTEAQRVLDDRMLTQYLRLRTRFSSAELEVIKASGAVRLRVIHPGRKAELIRTTEVGWRGVLVVCPSRRVTRLEAGQALVSDTDIVEALAACNGPRE